MKSDGRYNTSGLPEDSYEPGSDEWVLKNKLGITDKNTIDELEAREQLRALNECLELFEQESGVFGTLSAFAADLPTPSTALEVMTVLRRKVSRLSRSLR